MYEVMARRYRPALFDDVVGQEHIASTLKNAITRDRVAHAFIFTGGHGCGKTTMARILAKALVCQNGPTPQPCCQCPICLDVAAGRDADVLEIDGASNNGIEQIRTLREQAAYVPTRARYKIYIIDEVHMLSDGAFNALLKTLEEPPGHVKFILATTDPHKVPDTILSRCQRFDFRLVPQDTLASFFRSLATKENAAINDDALEAVAAFSGGSVRDGLVLLDQLLSFSDGEVTRQDVENLRGAAAAENVAGIYTHIINADVGAALALVDEVAARGTNVGDFLDQLIAFGRDLMLLTASGNAVAGGVSAYGPAREMLFELAKSVDLESTLLYLDVFAAARTRVRQRALTNPLVNLEMAVARLAGLGGITPVAKILEKLDAIPQGPAVPVATAVRVPAASERPALMDGGGDIRRDAEGEDRSISSGGKERDDFGKGKVETAVRELPPERTPERPETVSESRTPEPEDAVADKPLAPWDERPAAPVSKLEPEEPLVEALAPARDQEDVRVGATADDSAAKAAQEPVDKGDAAGRPVGPSVEKPDDALASDGDGLTPERVKAAWSEILDRVAEKHPSDLGYVLRTFFDGVEDGKIVLSGSQTTIESWEDRHRLKRLTQTVEEVLGAPVSFTFVARKGRRSQGDAKTEMRNQRDLLNNPVVDSVRSLFDGVIVAHRGIDSRGGADGGPEESSPEEEEEE